jgi:hypothetical protein
MPISTETPVAGCLAVVAAGRQFDCVLSKSMATWTWVIVLILAGVVVGNAVLFVWLGARTGWPQHVTRSGTAVLALFAVAVGLLLALTYGYAPSSFLVTQEAVVIQRPIKPIALPLEKITLVRRVTEAEFKGTVKTFGNGGLFARTGRFHSPGLGNFRMYLKDSESAVLIDTDERFVISPCEPDAFVLEVQTRMSERANRQRVAPQGEN